jgi:hypothetical protein
VVVLGIAGTLTQEQIFQPESFLRDYQVVAQVLGHKHIASVSIVWVQRQLGSSVPPQRREGSSPRYRVILAKYLVERYDTFERRMARAYRRAESQDAAQWD